MEEEVICLHFETLHIFTNGGYKDGLSISKHNKIKP